MVSEVHFVCLLSAANMAVFFLLFLGDLMDKTIMSLGVNDPRENFPALEALSKAFVNSEDTVIAFCKDQIEEEKKGSLVSSKGSVFFVSHNLGQS